MAVFGLEMFGFGRERTAPADTARATELQLVAEQMITAALMQPGVLSTSSEDPFNHEQLESFVASQLERIQPHSRTDQTNFTQRELTQVIANILNDPAAVARLIQEARRSVVTR